MKITFNKRELIRKGNQIKLMPLTDEGWFLIAQEILNDTLGEKFSFCVKVKAYYKNNGSIVKVVFSTC